MSVSQQQRRAVLAFVLIATAAIAACDSHATAPAPIAVRARPASIEGDTTRCLRGWVVINGVYVCNEDL